MSFTQNSIIQINYTADQALIMLYNLYTTHEEDETKKNFFTINDINDEVIGICEVKSTGGS